jgi:uncharacterized coiled-coil protein SlyX
MKISNIDSFIEEFRNGRGIFSRTSIELAVREIVRLRKENNKLKVRLAASENDLVLIEVNEMLKKTQARVQELEEQLSFFTEKTDAKYPEMPSEKSINFIPPESERE